VKRANGTGCIRKLSGNRRKPYAVYVTTTIDEDGKQHQKYVGSFKYGNEAERYLSEIGACPPEDINATVGQVYEKWIASKSSLTKSTLACYNAAWARMDSIKNKKIRVIKPSDLQAVVDNAEKDGKGRDTCRHIRAVAHGIYHYAMREGICQRDQSQYLILPASRKPDKSIFTDTEIELLKRQKDDVWASSVLVMLYTGMRVSEMLGLTKFNINLKERRITGAGLKTKAGKERSIPIHNAIFDILMKRMDCEGEYLFSATPGVMMSARNYRVRVFDPLMERLGMHHTPHECRHTTASLLVRSGVNPELTKYILGHAQYSTTMDIYNHPKDEDLLAAINQI